MYMLLSQIIWRKWSNLLEETPQVINNFQCGQWDHPIFQFLNAALQNCSIPFITRSSTLSTNNGYSLTANSESSAAHRFSLFVLRHGRVCVCERVCVWERERERERERLCSLCLYLCVSLNPFKTLISPYDGQKAPKGDKDGVMNGRCSQEGCLFSRLSLMRSQKRHWITGHGAI